MSPLILFFKDFAKDLKNLSQLCIKYWMKSAMFLASKCIIVYCSAANHSSKITGLFFKKIEKECERVRIKATLSKRDSCVNVFLWILQKF